MPITLIALHGDLESVFDPIRLVGLFGIPQCVGYERGERANIRFIQLENVRMVKSDLDGSICIFHHAPIAAPDSI